MDRLTVEKLRHLPPNAEATLRRSQQKTRQAPQRDRLRLSSPANRPQLAEMSSYQAEPGVEEPGDPSDRIRGQRVSIREVEAVFLAWIGHLLGSGANSVGKLYEFLSLGQRDVAIRFAMQFDQRRQT